MKNKCSLLILLSMFTLNFNAQESYTILWKKVDQLTVDNLPKSALAIVEQIYAKAQKEGNSPQRIKTLFYKSKFALTLEEEASLKVISDFKTQIANSTFPTRNVLENILANLYWQYYHQNRWKIYHRTTTEKKVDPIDFRTWDVHTLFKEIHTHFEASLENSLLLQQTDIYEFEAVLQIEKESKIYRPTLFDFLAHNALNFYKNNETNITKPTYEFLIDDARMLSDANTFSKIDLSTKDVLSLQFKALKLYQKLIVFHQKSNDKRPLVDVDIQRLQFVKQHATFTNIEEIYLKTLQKSKEQLTTLEVSGCYAFEIAQVYHAQAKSYVNSKNDAFRFKNNDALLICKQVINAFPESNAAKKCADLEGQIKAKLLSIQMEVFIPINHYSRVLVDYQNVDSLCFMVYEISKKDLLIFNSTHKDTERITQINRLKKVKTWTTTLRNEFDYLSHQTEVVVPQLASGSYLVVASENEKLSPHTLYGVSPIQITNLVLINVENSSQKRFQVVNRNTGKPIENATIHLTNKPNRHEHSIDKTLKTNQDGFASFTSTLNYYNVETTVSKETDQAVFGNQYLYKKAHNDQEIEEDKFLIKPFIFTDRSIYRPGQTVYFKTIFIQKKGRKSTPFTNTYIRVVLNNVNRQEVGKSIMKLNEFGAASGEFILPDNGITGNYSFSFNKIQENNNKRDNYKNIAFTNYNIAVEEYKRPTFKTEFNPVSESFKLNDTITISGFSKAFSGTHIPHAKVVYRVHRKVQYPRWNYWYRPYWNSAPQEITHGEMASDGSGNFAIRFVAQPDESVSKERLPVFNYEITADVTDINGETRSATTSIKIGYHSLLVRMELPLKIDKNSKKQGIAITTENLNGTFVPASGTLKIYKLQSPKNPQRKRAWKAPDYQDISESTFRKLFPNEPYLENESEENSWKKGLLVFETIFDTSKHKKIELSNYKNWLSGKYIAVLESKDKFNQKVTDEQSFSLYSTKEKNVADHTLFTITTNKATYKPNEKVVLQIGSASKNITVMVQVEKEHQITASYLVHLNNKVINIEIPVQPKDIGGFAIQYHFVNYNSFKSGTLAIVVPNIQETFEIETNVFRDKLQPGQQETWSFTIKNDHKDKIVAEVLASMYDASLDEFKAHSWQFTPITRAVYYPYISSTGYHSFKTNGFSIYNRPRRKNNIPTQTYDTYNWFGFSLNKNMGLFRMAINDDITGITSENKKYAPSMRKKSANENEFNEMITKKNISIPSPDIEINNTEGAKNKETSFKQIHLRKNLQETAFFYPQLRTDKNGEIRFSFTTPEALTQWKLQLLAHTTDLKSTTKTLQTTTQKELMVIPNAPRFLRAGDQITFSAKISNITNQALNGFAHLELTDVITGKEINAELNNTEKTKNFTVDKEGNTSVSWRLTIPETVQAVQYKIVAKAGDFSDGEQNAVPVLSNRMLVTETMPLWVKSNETKTFRLDKLKNTATRGHADYSSTLKHHQLTLEITSNPAWYAIQSLPYLMEYSSECSEQTFAKYYANTLASFIAHSNPRIQEVFNAWKSSGALLSNLEKNEELKLLIIQETPWVRDAQTETEQKKRLALLFDVHKMKNEREKSVHQLKSMQMDSGGFPWFTGSNTANLFITQHIVAGFGHLKKLGVIDFEPSTKEMIEKAVRFLDDKILEHHEQLLRKAEKIKQKATTSKEGDEKAANYLAKNHLSYFLIQYLYMRSFYADISMSENLKTAVAYYKNQTVDYWNRYHLYAKAQIAVAHFRTGNKKTASKILKSIKENSITSDELGMYWKENIPGYSFYQAPIETQALLIETFSEMLDPNLDKDKNAILDNLKRWLLKNKQTTRWKTTKATTEAIYALLLTGSDWISVTDMVGLKIGDKEIMPTALEDVKIEAGTGYFKTSWSGTEITPKMSEVRISKKGNGIAWGALYWQYFENLDNISAAETALQLKKKLFLKQNSDRGKELKEISENTQLKVGDLMTIRIELRSDRDLDFIHLKDMRASGVEPINVLSKYKYQDGLGYYQSTKDAVTHFFFDRLPKGIYVFEYDVRINNAGVFSNGISNIESMYAPEFASHSKGIKIEVK